MVRTKTDSLVKAGIASLAFAAVALAFVPMVGAQAMGEYGAAVGNSAGVAASAPDADLPSIPASSAQTGSSGATETREDDSSPEDAKTADTDSSQSGDEWSEVKSSADGN